MLPDERFVGSTDIPNYKLRITYYDEHNYVYVGELVYADELWMLRTRYETNYKRNLDDPFVHKKYFLAALLIMDTETKKI